MVIACPLALECKHWHPMTLLQYSINRPAQQIIYYKEVKIIFPLPFQVLD